MDAKITVLGAIPFSRMIAPQRLAHFRQAQHLAHAAMKFGVTGSR